MKRAIEDTLNEAHAELTSNPALAYAGRVYEVSIEDADYDITMAVTRKGEPNFIEKYKEALES